MGVVTGKAVEVTDSDETAISVSDNQAASRFEARDGDHVVGLADYVVTGDVVVMPHTEVDAAYQGRGVAGRIVAAAVESAVQSGRRVDPQCPYVRDWFDRHPEYADHRV